MEAPIDAAVFLEQYPTTGNGIRQACVGAVVEALQRVLTSLNPCDDLSKLRVVGQGNVFAFCITIDGCTGIHAALHILHHPVAALTGKLEVELCLCLVEVRYAKSAFCSVCGFCIEHLSLVDVLDVVVTFVERVDLQSVCCDNHLQQGLVELLKGGGLVEGACESQGIAQSLHACCCVETGVCADLVRCGKHGAVGCDVALQVSKRDVLKQVSNDGVTVPVLVVDVIEINAWINVNDGFVRVVESLVVAKLRHNIANHIDVIAT